MVTSPLASHDPHFPDIRHKQARHVHRRCLRQFPQEYPQSNNPLQSSMPSTTRASAPGADERLQLTEECGGQE